MINHELRLAEIARLKAERERLSAEWRHAKECAQGISERYQRAHIAHVDARDAYLVDCGLYDP